MERTRQTVWIIGLVIIAGSAVLGYGLGNYVERRASTRGQESPSPAVLVTASPTTTVSAPTSLPFESTPTATPLTSSAPSAAAAVKLETLPARVTAGSSLVLRWRVDGPAGTKDTTTRVKAQQGTVQRVVSPEQRGFALPAAFEATLVARERGLLTITVEAIVNGRTVKAQKQIRVE